MTLLTAAIIETIVKTVLFAALIVTTNRMTIAIKEIAKSIHVATDLKCHKLLIGSYIELSPFKSQLKL
jgi:hypothetical protein